VLVADVLDSESALALIKAELQVLAVQDRKKPATTLIVLPPALFESPRCDSGASNESAGLQDDEERALDTFERFLGLGEKANEMAQNMGKEGLAGGDALLLTFHPSSTFSDVPNDPGAFAMYARTCV
jgi:hypothetical protein